MLLCPTGRGGAPCPSPPLPWQAPAPRAEPRAAPAAPATPATPELGASIGRRGVNPLDFIKRPVPLLSSEKRDAPKRALGALEAAAAQDETCVWQRVRAMPECDTTPTTVTFTPRRLGHVYERG